MLLSPSIFPAEHSTGLADLICDTSHAGPDIQAALTRHDKKGVWGLIRSLSHPDGTMKPDSANYRSTLIPYMLSPSIKFNSDCTMSAPATLYYPMTVSETAVAFFGKIMDHSSGKYTDHAPAAEDLLKRNLDEYYPKIFRSVAAFIFGTGLDPEDLTQETFLKAYNNLDGFRQHSSPYTWLYRIARNTCLDAIRKKKFRDRFSWTSFRNDGDDAILEFPDTGTEKPVVEQKEEIELVRKGIAKLQDDFRMVIILRELQDLSYQEIAEVLNITESAVKSRLFKARQALRVELIRLGAES